MSKAEKHSTDEGKFQSTFNEYAHGKGNGKSKSAIYNHHKKWVIEQEQEVIEIEEITPTLDWSSISWLDDDDEETIKPTIPKPIRKIATGKGEKGEITAAEAATQGQLIRWGFMGLDRGVTHWGRGVMSRPDWELERSPQDYDALEGATTNLLEAHGVGIHLSPEIVWGTVVAAAYIPPVVYVGKNADPSKSKGFIARVKQFLNRKKLPKDTKEDEN